MTSSIRPTLTTAPTAPERSTEKERLRKACQDFEAIMLKSLLKEMRASVPQDGLLGTDSGREMMQDLMDQEAAVQMARTQGIGIGDRLYETFQRHLGEATPQPATLPPADALKEK
jgi:peptidoglycan hydrolase FlgJ